MIFAIILLAVFGAAFLFKDTKEQRTAPQITEEKKGKTFDVGLTDQGYIPQRLTIKAGDKVTWTNKSGAVATVNSAPHPAHTDYAPLNLGQIEDGASVSLVFDNTGTYRYHNHLNSTQFGSITVE